MSNKTIVFDFDGVIHLYTSGWQGADVIPDEPSEEVISAIRKLRKDGYEVVVVSTRCADPRGMKAVQEYLKRHGIKVDNVCATKPPALVYVDDRAVCYRPGIDLVKRIVRQIENIDHRSADRPRQPEGDPSQQVGQREVLEAMQPIDHEPFVRPAAAAQQQDHRAERQQRNEPRPIGPRFDIRRQQGEQQRSEVIEQPPLAPGQRAIEQISQHEDRSMVKRHQDGRLELQWPKDEALQREIVVWIERHGLK